VFEYWTHALSYVPVRDIRFFLGAMRRYRLAPDDKWFGSVPKADVRKVLRRIRTQGPLTIRDIDDDVLVEKNHPWASRKPSKRALQAAFYAGLVTISERGGMLKTYELMERHFGWNRRPRPAAESEVAEYLLDRALQAQGVVSVDSITFLKEKKRKEAVLRMVERRVRRGELIPLTIEGAGKAAHWATPQALEEPAPPAGEVVHILSPFDPLIIQRKRLEFFFGYQHVFEAYVPQPKRKFGYFALPVLVGDEIVAAIDIKTDRAQRKILLQKWTWVGKGSARRHRTAIDGALERFERFQLGL
jgi:uncharacterized protein YcaQ